jgi:hypothetical protein
MQTKRNSPLCGHVKRLREGAIAAALVYPRRRKDREAQAFGPVDNPGAREGRGMEEGEGASGANREGAI